MSALLLETDEKDSHLLRYDGLTWTLFCRLLKQCPANAHQLCTNQYFLWTWRTQLYPRWEAGFQKIQYTISKVYFQNEISRYNIAYIKCTGHFFPFQFLLSSLSFLHRIKMKWEARDTQWTAHSTVMKRASQIEFHLFTLIITSNTQQRNNLSCKFKSYTICSTTMIQKSVVVRGVWNQIESCKIRHG